MVLVVKYLGPVLLETLNILLFSCAERLFRPLPILLHRCRKIGKIGGARRAMRGRRSTPMRELVHCLIFLWGSRARAKLNLADNSCKQ